MCRRVITTNNVQAVERLARPVELGSDGRSPERHLARVNRLTESVTAAVSHSESRADVERSVCERLCRDDFYPLAWVGEETAADDELVVRESGGADLLPDDRSMPLTGDGPSARAVERHTVQTVPDLAELPRESVHRRLRGDRPASVAVVPLVYNDTLYGVLHLYAAETGAFDEHETPVFRALGTTISTAIDGHEARRLLTADRVTELHFDVDDGSFPLSALAAAVGGSVVYEGSTRLEAGTLRLFVSISDPSADVESTLEGSDDVPEGFVVARRNGTVAVSVEVGEPTLFTGLAEYGAAVGDLSIPEASGTARLQVDLPPDGDARAVLSLLESEYDHVDLVRKTDREPSLRTTATSAACVADHLTDRQHTVLDLAHRSGYYEFPRSVSGEALAESIGIARSTFHQHLRVAEQKLVDEFFGS